ncbi:aldo/keto reductase [Sediminivirga luteola]|uniref:aldo/keto reductase n=1 Tax=Sediminivirga luteola TaxID=1774748 RepID=UPI001F55E449|nr:aldo/keto reductase [Sediminivirga luteola]MCI2264709.1 aldo/keto reductase [Sediminivirga luteola]
MTGLDFGTLVLGGNVFGWTADREESFRILDAFVAAGGKSIDTADVYSAWAEGNSGGESETIIGEWLASRGNRESVVLATKVFQHPQRPGLSPGNVRQAIEDSLRRLRTDYVDLYYAHRDDPDVPQEEYIAVFDELVRAGKAREVGATTFTAARLRSAVKIAKDNGLTPFTVSQDPYNLVERGIEADVLPAVQELGLVELPYWSLASGFLTGKYRPGKEVDSVRAGKAAGYLDEPRNLMLLGLLDELAAERGVSMAAVALAWLRTRPAVPAPIASARTVEQLPALVESMNLDLTADEIVALNDASSRG